MTSSGDLDALWAAVTDPTRRQVLDVLLARGPASATTIAAHVSVTRQAVAKHLAVLSRAGVVRADRHGREVRYAVDPDRLDVITRRMAEIAAEWDGRLVAIKRIAEDVQLASQTDEQGD